jgi:hypothetical protein
MTEFQNSKPVLVIKLGTRPQGGESGGPILEFGISLGFGACDLLFCNVAALDLLISQSVSEALVDSSCLP